MPPVDERANAVLHMESAVQHMHSVGVAGASSLGASRRRHCSRRRLCKRPHRCSRRRVCKGRRHCRMLRPGPTRSERDAAAGTDKVREGGGTSGGGLRLCSLSRKMLQARAVCVCLCVCVCVFCVCLQWQAGCLQGRGRSQQHPYTQHVTAKKCADRNCSEY